jgi:Tfp pilus assembly protein FimT
MKNRLGSEAGLSVIEILIVIVIVGIAVMMITTLAADRVRVAKVRVAVNQLEIDLRAARLSAVSNRSPVEVVIRAEPGNSYEYTDARGERHAVQMPAGVRIVSSTSPIRFLPNGTVLGGAKTLIETDLTDSGDEKWVVETNVLGISRAARTNT